MRKKDVIGIALDDPDGYLTPGAHLETIMHLETYRARPDVGAVIHTHPVYSIALGATAGGLELLSHDGLLFPDGVPVFDGTAGLVTTPRDGQGVARALGGGRAVLLRNHGILAAGPDISWAVLTALTLERAARIQFIARTLGETGADPARGGPRAVGQQVPRGVRRRVLAGLVRHARQLRHDGNGARHHQREALTPPRFPPRNCCSTSCATGSA